MYENEILDSKLHIFSPYGYENSVIEIKRILFTGKFKGGHFEAIELQNIANLETKSATSKIENSK